jgi:hypothetical protein
MNSKLFLTAPCAGLIVNRGGLLKKEESRFFRRRKEIKFLGNKYRIT